MKTRITAVPLSIFFCAIAYAAPALSPQIRVTPDDVDGIQAHDSGAGTSGVAGVAHFAETKADKVIVYISGNGPTDTVYVNE